VSELLKEVVRQDPLSPSPQLLIKLGSAVVHAEEFLSPHGHEFDKQAFDQLLADPDVKAWIATMTTMAFLPVKRNK
jgi:hypothetical protein